MRRGRCVVADSGGLPAWVYKRDGRLVPFEPDKISQALFAAGETLGGADAFLARELTDGILHFLEKETGGAIPSTTQIAELIAKVVRELGQPGLAQSFAEGKRRGLRSARTSPAPVPDRTVAAAADVFRFRTTDSPAAVARQCLREYSLQAIFSRDLSAAHRDGLLTYLGLEAPLELAGCVFDLAGQGWEHGQNEGQAWVHSRRSGALVQALLEVRRRAAGFVAIDGPEYALTPFASAGDLAKNSGELAAGLDATGLGAVINLNCSRPPGWAEDQGPLFADVRRATPPAHVEEYRTVLLEQLLRPAFSGRVRIDWHLGPGDFGGTEDRTSDRASSREQQTSADGEARLLRLLRLAVESPSFTFVFDRPSRPVSLAEGIDRKRPAVLVGIGLNLPRLLDMPDVKGDAESFLVKLASLARMAVSAAVQKRNYLRRQQAGQQLARGFLLDRAQLLAVPIGLEAVVRSLTGQALEGSSLGQQIVASLCANLRQAGSAANLEVAVDGMPWSAQATTSGFSAGADENAAKGLPEPAAVAGLTGWSPGGVPKNQVKASGLLHAAAETGTAAVLIPQDQVPQPDDLLALLHFAWSRTEVARLRFVGVPHQQQQLAW